MHCKNNNLVNSSIHSLYIAIDCWLALGTVLVVIRMTPAKDFRPEWIIFPPNHSSAGIAFLCPSFIHNRRIGLSLVAGRMPPSLLYHGQLLSLKSAAEDENNLVLFIRHQRAAEVFR